MRLAACDTQILGYHVPKGTEVFLISNGPSYLSAPLRVDERRRSPSSIENKDRIGTWAPSDIAIFKPERWLVKSKDGVEEFSSQAGPMHTFGGGLRGCFGRKQAELQFKIIFTLLI